MPSTTQPIPVFPEGGINRATARHRVPLGEWWDVQNMRFHRGRMEQTRQIGVAAGLTTLNSVVPNTPIRLMMPTRTVSNAVRYLILDQQTARYANPDGWAQTAIPCVLQTKIPDNETINGECLLYGHNVTDFSTAGDKITVEIQTTTTFRWRRNAGTWTSSITVGPEVALGVNGLKVSFQDDAGFVAGNLWEWTRQVATPYTGADSSTFNFPFDTTLYDKDVYLGGVERNVMRVRDNFITSVGYVRAYGKYVRLFNNHLVVGHYSRGAFSGVTGVVDSSESSTPYTVGWSHLGNPDQFFSTDINEADEYQIPQNEQHEDNNLGITGMEIWAGRLFVFTSDAVTLMSYVGLPTVMQFEHSGPAIGSIFQAGVIKTSLGIYFIARDNVYLFNGSMPQPIGTKVKDRFYAALPRKTDSYYQRTYAFYNPDTKEVGWVYFQQIDTGVYQPTAMILNEETGEWYFRNLPVDTGSDGLPLCAAPAYDDNDSMIWGRTAEVLQDITPGVNTGAVKDLALADSEKFTAPQLTTGLIAFDDPFYRKEINTLFLDGYGQIAGGGDIAVKVEYAVQNFAENGDVTWVALARKWTNAVKEGRLTELIKAFGYLSLRFTFENEADTTTAVYDCKLNIWQPFIYRGSDVEK